MLRSPHRSARFPRATSAALLAIALASSLWTPAAPAEEARPRGTRMLYLVRHGVYDEADTLDPEVGKHLVPEGREQARLTGEGLASLPVRFDAIHASTMTRARETAEIVAQSFPGLKPQLSPDLRECTPPTYREDIMARERAGTADSCGLRLEGVFARYLRPTAGRDSTEIVVCHGNVIRYLWCRALGADPKLWAGMAITNCGISVIQVRPDGSFRLGSYNEAGHLPPRLQTFSIQRRVFPDSLARK